MRDNVPVQRSVLLIAFVALAWLSGASVHALDVTNITPSRGPTGGGTTVFISGSGFTGATQVLFGATPATSFVVNNDTSIQAVSPASAAAIVSVTVITPQGQVVLEEAWGWGPLPVAIADSYTVAFGQTLSVNSPGVLSNDDPNGGGGVVTELGTNVTSGTLTLTPDGGFTYVPNATFTGSDRFTYRSRNATGVSNYAAVTLTVGVPSGPLPPSALRVTALTGNRVTLRWTPPLAGPAPIGYVIEGGVSPGETATRIVVDNVPTFTFDAPSGTLFLRVRTRVGLTQSEPSNEVQALVNVPAPPSAPDNFLALVNDSSLALSWRNTFAGGAPLMLVLDVTGSLTTSLPLGITDGFMFAGVPAGTYTLTLRAVNAFGSAAAPPVTLTFPGPCSGLPGSPTNFAAYKVGTTIHVTWDPPATGAAPTSYVLNVGGSFAGSFVTGARAMSGAVGPGTYTLNVTAINPCGASAATATQSVSVP
jgi:hypothetical protein